MIPDTSTLVAPKHLDMHCEDDLFIAHVRGPYDAAVAWSMERTYRAQVEKYGYRLVLIHAEKTTTITPEARRLMAEWNAARMDPAAGAVVGASFTTKTVARLLTRAVEMITGKPIYIRFFDSEPDARAWLDGQRVRLKQETAISCSTIKAPDVCA